MIDVNAHLHTPYSFSAFSDVKQALDMAASEGVKVVGINDFYSMDGYREWKEGCAERALFPLFGIEFISLNAEDQAAGLRVNDPNNPGLTYISGKGLDYTAAGGEPELVQLTIQSYHELRCIERGCGDGVLRQFAELSPRAVDIARTLYADRRLDTYAAQGRPFADVYDEILAI